jgi:hypothetical protein
LAGILLAVLLPIPHELVAALSPAPSDTRLNTDVEFVVRMVTIVLLPTFLIALFGAPSSENGRR